MTEKAIKLKEPNLVINLPKSAFEKRDKRKLHCFVPGCKVQTPETPAGFFYDFPRVDIYNKDRSELIKVRRQAWIRALNLQNYSQLSLNNAKICYRHFFYGRPSPDPWIYERDWVPNVNLCLKQGRAEVKALKDLIENLPEVNDNFDTPDYVLLDETQFNESQIEADIVKKYLSMPQEQRSDRNGCYKDDHDYLGLPFQPSTLEESDLSFDHNYSLSDLPACCFQDWRNCCNICAQNFPNLFLFNNHLMQHTLKNDVLCEFCGQTFFTTACLHNHLAIHTTLCDVCGNEVPLKQLTVHRKVNRKQKNELVPPAPYKLVRVYFCIFCMLKIREKDAYLEHMKKHRGRGLKKTVRFVKVA